MGDSITPYACDEASPADEGESCVFIASYGTIFGGLLGINAAAIVRELSVRKLMPPFLIYCMPFPVICFAATWGGRWANPFLLDGSGIFIAFLVTIMRTC